MSTIFAPRWSWLRCPVAVSLLVVGVAFIYYALPNADEPFRLITLGAVLAVIVWVAASLGFSYCVSNFVLHSTIYGTLGRSWRYKSLFYHCSCAAI
ncbi:MAG: YihY/virulence factor BrkB family protein [Rubrobacter sp.]|nr:YihY/virulence factor BrkB family protein [Rubrobacter sp.]